MRKLIVFAARFLSLCAVLLALPAIAAAQETLTAPFVNGPNGVTTTNSYSGSVSINVSGFGQAAESKYSDAFYIFTDNSGNPITPEHHSDFGLCINNQPVDSYLATIPSFRSDNTYQFTISIGSSPQQITFGVCDTFTADNSGSFTITLRVTPSGKVYTGGKPKGKAPNLIVLVHGCCTDKKRVKEWSDLGSLIKETIRQSHTPKDWEIVVWDWSSDTPAHDYRLCPHCFPDDASYAYIAADIARGPELAVAISTYPYKHVHLIGHSAGAKLIDEAAFHIALNNIDQPFLHITFLDAYTRDDNDKINYGGLPVGYPHYVEHYVDRHLPSTDACLSNAFNFDISNWLHSPDPINDPFGHRWPRVWYKESVTSTSPKFRYGYNISLEGAGKKINKLINIWANFPAGQQCELSTIFNNNPTCQPAACW